MNVRVKFQQCLLNDYRIDVIIFAFAGSLWARVSAQAYNTLFDYKRFAKVTSDLCGT